MPKREQTWPLPAWRSPTIMDERLARGNSYLHNLNPRVKIIGATLFTLATTTTQQFPVAFAAFTLSLSLLLFAQLPLIDILKRILVVNSFTVFLWVTLPLTYGGENSVNIGSLELCTEGILLASLITIKTNAILICFMALISTSTVAQLGHGLERLGLPERLCFLLLFSYRFIFVIYEEYRRLLRAAKIRNFTPGSNIHTYRTFGYLFGMTLVKSYNRSQRVHQAMLLRGFNGKLIPLTNSNLNKNDYTFLIVHIFSVCALVILGLI
jgi:cobalt/nickel transport system permease protein